MGASDRNGVGFPLFLVGIFYGQVKIYSCNIEGHGKELCELGDVFL